MLSTLKCPNHKNRNAKKRGLCPSCYNLFAKRVERGQENWPALEARGLVLPKQRPGPRQKEMKAV